MSGQTVLLNTSEGVATITLNRPQVYNALDQTMAEELVHTLQSCADDSNVRVVVLTGAGRGFCAGGDMKAAWKHIQAGGDPRHFFRDLTVFFHRAISDMRLMEKPIIAAINGATGGGGLSLAAACDLRVAAASAKIKQAYTSIGLVPDGGWTVLVPALIGPARAAQFLLLDPVLDAGQAQALGLVQEVVADDRLGQRVREIALALAAGPAAAFAGAKALLNTAVFERLDAQLERERQRIINQSGTAEFLEGLAAFIEKRTPGFPVS